MTQHVQELIDKIKREGIEAAEKEAKALQAEAHENAREIVARAKHEASELIREAEARISTMKQASENAVRQAARDVILNVRQHIESIVQALVLKSVGEALTAERLYAIISRVIEKAFEAGAPEADIKIMLSPSDVEQLKKGFLGKLKERFKQGIEFQSSDDISKGFTISFDGGKSAIDFTDASLTDYVSAYLNPEIAALLKDVKIP